MFTKNNNHKRKTDKETSRHGKNNPEQHTLRLTLRGSEGRQESVNLIRSMFRTETNYQRERELGERELNQTEKVTPKRESSEMGRSRERAQKYWSSKMHHGVRQSLRCVNGVREAFIEER